MLPNLKNPMNPLDERQAFIINANYELFVVLITLLSIVNGVLWLFPLEPYTRSVIQIIEYLISAFLLLDFFFRLLRAHSKRGYFVHNYGWLDLVGSLPVFGLRLARLARPLILGRRIRRDDLSEMSGVIVQRRAQSTLLAVLFVALLIFEISGIAILRAESESSEANIQTASDALWWAYVTVATVGYGDRYPVTSDGRIVGVLLMTAGVGLFSVLTSYLADWFRRPRKSGPIIKPRAGAPASQDASAGLGEIQRLLEEYDTQHQQTMAELQSRLDEIKKTVKP
jgi:voltage-gated potassium channel Kch